jgi:hypothetical protein
VTRPRRLATAAAALTVAAAACAGCGTQTLRATPRVAPPPVPGLATSVVTAGGTWAVAVLGGAAAQDNNFWQLFVRPAGSSSWRLATPPGVASNGGLVLAGLPGRAALAAFLPSQDLEFSPLATTTDNAASWTGGVLDARLAEVPGALAAAPDGQHLLALTTSGRVEGSGADAASWTTLTSMQSLSSSRAGRRCAPDAADAVSFTPSGLPLLAVSCARPGVAGIYSYAAGTWRSAAPALPAALSGQRVQVLRLASTSTGESALLAARSAAGTSLVAAWSRDGAHWTVSSPVRVGAGAVTASGFGAAGAAGAASATGAAAAGTVGAGDTAWVLLSGGRAYTVAGPGGAWRQTPRLPAGTSVLSPGPYGKIDALAAHGSKLTDWQLTGAAGTWRRQQVLSVPIQYGSSG